MKSIDILTPKDFQKHPVWTFCNSDIKGELNVKPIIKLPISNTRNKIIGIQAVLSNDKRLFSYIGNIDLDNPELSNHFITFSFWINNSWFHLSRYHDFDYKINGPLKLQKLLNLRYNNIFPIKIDLNNIIKGEDALVNYNEPSKKLKRAEIIALSLE